VRDQELAEAAVVPSVLVDLIQGQLDATLAPKQDLASTIDLSEPSLGLGSLAEPPTVRSAPAAFVSPAPTAAPEPSRETVPANPSAPVSIQSDRQADYDKEQNSLTFTGKVGLDHATFQLRSEKLVVFLKDDRTGLEHAEASGNVIVQVYGSEGSEKTIASGTRAIYEPASGELTLNGWPRLQQKGSRQESTASSTKIVYTIATGEFRTVGPVRTVKGS
jgi:lipopolysaccharide transport protein LptA